MKHIITFIKEKSLFFYLFLFFLFLLSFITINNFIMDNYWNYGFSYNIANGLIPYRDFNMVLFPLFPLLCALVMKIFGSKLIIYYIVSSLIATLTISFIKKLNGGKSLILLIIYFFLLFQTGGYNLLSILLFFIILYLELTKKNDYLIGLVLSLIVLNNQKMLVLLLPTMLLKDYKRILKRLMIFIIPFQLLLLYLSFNNALYSFFDYTIFGLFDFGNKNGHMTIWFVLELLIIFYLLYKYLKTKDISSLYCLCFQIIVFPIFDPYHFVLGLIPFSFYVFSGVGNIKKLNILFLFLILFNFTFKTIQLFDNDSISFNTNINHNFFLTTSSQNLNSGSEMLYKFYKEHNSENIHFFTGESYYYKLDHKLKIDSYDLLLDGNNGYNGHKKIMNMLKSEKDALFIIYDEPNRDTLYDQFDCQLIDYIMDNYEQVTYLGNNFYVYRIVN